MIAPRCRGCGLAACLCHAAHEARQRAQEPTFKSVDRGVAHSLIITGIATTRGSYSSEVTLRTPEGKRTVDRPGLDPQRLRTELPVPLLSEHDWAKRIGSVFETWASPEALYFRAAVAPPWAGGHDPQVQERTWADIRDGKLLGVSIHIPDWPDYQRAWELREVSICRKGNNPSARITKAVFPRVPPEFGEARGWPTRAMDGAEFSWPTPEISHSVTRRVEEQRREERRSRAAAQADESLPYRGVWREGRNYARGQLVTDRGTLWHANESTGDRPGSSNAWTLMVKHHHKGGDDG